MALQPDLATAAVKRQGRGGTGRGGGYGRMAGIEVEWGGMAVAGRCG